MSDQSGSNDNAGIGGHRAWGSGQLSAILFVDACGSCRVFRDDQDKAIRSIGAMLVAIREIVEERNGNICNIAGDGLFATFSSAQDAVRCALEIQHCAPTQGGRLRIKFRVGIHIGETFQIDGQTVGDSVNVAARIESAAVPGGVLVSRPVFEALRGQSDLMFMSKGFPDLKNIGADLELFEVVEGCGLPIEGRFKLRLLGRFALFGPDGNEKTLSRESQALLAATALAGRSGCTRTWLQATLWEARSETDRPDCLEAALANLRRTFGSPFTRILDVDGTLVAFNPGALTVDVAAVMEHGWHEGGALPDLLEGFEFNSEAFGTWLRRERGRFRSSMCLRTADPAAEVAAKKPQETVDTQYAPPPARFCLGVMPSMTEDNDARASMLADIVADWLIRSLTDMEAVEIRDYRNSGGRDLIDPEGAARNGPDLLIQCRAASAGDMTQIAVSATRTEDRKLIWSQSVIAETSDFLALPGASVSSFVSYATDALLSALTSGRHVREPAANQAAKMALSAVHRLLTMTEPGLERVEADIVNAYSADPKPVYLAWLSYMATFRVGERYGTRDGVLEEQARALARKALEADPHNALVLGLTAQVHSYIFHEFAFANDLVSRALEANPLSSMCWDTASLLYSYTGRASEAMDAANNARRLGKHSPYRHLFDGACCVAAAVNGRFDEAVNYGESVMAVQPQFHAVMRYLAASYGFLGDSDRAAETMNKLIVLEPDLSVERIRDINYPVPSKECALLLETGLGRVGLKRHP